MTFKELTNELMDQGWRCYALSKDRLDLLTSGPTLHSLAIRSLIEVRVYEGKSLVFVRDTYPKEDE